MNKMKDIIEGIVDQTISGKKSRIPARLDFLQSATGLLLAIFIKFHIIFVSSILISKDFMLKVDMVLSGSPFIKGGHPAVISLLANFIFIVIVVHALMALRKFPSSYRQYRNFNSHMTMFPHGDTKLWNIQIITGFALFFLASIHIYQMISNPADVGPYASSDRIFSDWAWPMYLLLLIAVELHATIGLYRLTVKWGWFEGKDYRKRRILFQKIRNFIIIFYLILGLASLAAYMKIGYEHKEHYGERYQHAKVESRNMNKSVQCSVFSVQQEKKKMRNQLT